MNQKIPKILSEYPNIFIKFDFLLEIQNYNQNFKPKLKNICIPNKYPKYTNIYNLHKHFGYFGSQRVSGRSQTHTETHISKKIRIFLWTRREPNQNFRVDFGLAFRGPCKIPMRKRELHKIYTKFQIK